jgi:hypothetical protein
VSYLDIAMNLVRLYDLREDRRRVEHLQAASLSRSDAGLAIEPALVGSDEWWALVRDGSLSESVIDGVIEKVYWASMGDWPEFELHASDGSRSSWTREGDISRYVEGLNVRLGFVRHLWKKQATYRIMGSHSSLVTFVEIEESNLRSDPRAPGPGGIGLRLPHEPRSRN